MMKKIFSMLLFLLFCLTQQSLYAKSITLTTYYPAPFGAYDRLRLVPWELLNSGCSGLKALLARKIETAPAFPDNAFYEKQALSPFYHSLSGRYTE